MNNDPCNGCGYEQTSTDVTGFCKECREQGTPSAWKEEATAKSWRTRVEDQGVDIIERGRTVVFARDGIELARAYPQEYRSGNGGYVFRHVFEVFGTPGKKFVVDLNEVAGCVEFVFGW